jgi:hypothetical protein
MQTLQIEEIEGELREHQRICQEALRIAEREQELLRSESEVDFSETNRLRKNVLAQLGTSLENIKAQRAKWSQMDAPSKARHPAILELLRQSQELIMKVMLFERENEQLYLRRGLLPAHRIPSMNRQRPNYVAGLYQRHAPG